MLKKNDEVIKNQKLGKIMTIGNENYLGFEIWNNKAKRLNPIEYLENKKRHRLTSYWQNSGLKSKFNFL